MQDEQEVFIKILKSINHACLQYTRKKNFLNRVFELWCLIIHHFLKHISDISVQSKTKFDYVFKYKIKKLKKSLDFVKKRTIPFSYLQNMKNSYWIYDISVHRFNPLTLCIPQLSLFLVVQHFSSGLIANLICVSLKLHLISLGFSIIKYQIW